jgi:hypothetical protein
MTIDLDWGHVTPEAVNFSANVVTHVYNHDIGSSTKIDRTIRFISGRINHFSLHVPKGATHHIKIDARGQQVDPTIISMIKERIKRRVDSSINLEIDIITA